MQIPQDKNIPPGIRTLLEEDKNKNGKSDFFEDNPLNILKKLVLLGQKDYKGVINFDQIPKNPKKDALRFIIYIVLLIAFPPIGIIAIILGTLRFVKTQKQKNFNSKKESPNPFLKEENIYKPKSPPIKESLSTNFPLPSRPPSHSPNRAFSGGDIIRIILLIGIIGYVFYYFFAR